jgi:hypothetical protein
MNNSMAKCVLGYFLTQVEDSEIKPIVQFAYDLAVSHLTYLTNLFEQEQLPLPTGFTNEDVNLNAPRLYSDSFMLTYINHMSKVGLLAYSGFVSMSARKDVRTHFIDALQKTSDLFDRSSDVALSKGLFVRAPYIAYPTKTDFVDNKSYLSGFSLFSKQRPLNTVEISHLYMNIQTNLIGSHLSISFAQTSPREDVQKWMLRGNEISKKHVKIFSATLIDNDIQPPIPSDVAITNSTSPTFSDKLVMSHMALLSATGAGNYATAAAASQRSDLFLNYERLSLEVAQYAKDGVNIMINNKWLEQPPGTTDKEKLAHTKDTE